MKFCQAIIQKKQILWFMVLFFVFVLLPFFVFAVCQPYGTCTDYWVCCPGGTPSLFCNDSPYSIVNAGYGTLLGAKGIELYVGCTDCWCSSSGCSAYSQSETRWGDCSDGTRITLVDCFTQTCPIESCTSGTCKCGGFVVGACPGGPGGAENCTDGIDNNSNGLIDCNDSACPPCCQVANLTCPTTCTTGINSTFTVNYLTKINSPYNPNIWNPNYLYQIGKLLSYSSWYGWVWGSQCPDSVTVINRNWYPATQTFYCDSISNNPDNVRVDCDIQGAPVGCPPGDGGYLTCTVTPVAPPLPPALGYVKVKGPGTMGIIKLRLISVANALLAKNGAVKVARFAGDIQTAADLVATSSPDASPVRIMTPVGIRAWRMER